jgi:hypothetical protein
MGITYGRPLQDNADDIKVFSDLDRDMGMLSRGAVSWTSK